jgi:serine/threonine protein phosphatase PrpC
VLKWRVGLAEYRLHYQDRSLVDLELGVFGVFDGVGEFASSGEAAQLAAEVVAEACRASDSPTSEAMVAGCARAETLIRQRAVGATTATLAWVVGRLLLYVSVGDSRLYHQPAGAPSLVQVTADEGEGNILYNVLGEGPDRRGAPVAPQRGTIPISSGDKVLLVTDGITGDFAPDLLTAKELTTAIEGDDPQRSADRLVEIARKRDDRTALLIFLN